MTAASSGGPPPESVTGTDWERLAALAPRNALELQLENVRSARIDGRRAGLTGRHCLRISIHSDGPAQVRLALRLRSGAPGGAGGDLSGPRPVAPAGARVQLGRRGAVIEAGADPSNYVIYRRADDS